MNYSLTIDDPLEVEFDQLTCSDDDYESDGNNDWFIDEPNANVKNKSITSSKHLVEKIENPKVITIPFSIGLFNIKQALCDLGFGINLMQLVYTSFLAWVHLNQYPLIY